MNTDIQYNPNASEECIQAANELMLRYRSVTIDEIVKAYINQKNEIPMFIGFKVANMITGFGFKTTCTLCKAVNYDCNQCIYAHIEGRTNCNDKHLTYHDIFHAHTTLKLQSAFRARADYIQKVLHGIYNHINPLS
ncbi:MAG: hypothetical protein EOM76_10250 [Sphingobacteriia bacterium]|nr:hypothetical protein [Sphingobacteriia bacterium]